MLGDLTRKLVAGLWLATSLLTAAQAADLSDGMDEPEPDPTQRELAFELRTYGFFPGMTGNVGVFGADPVHVDINFDQIFNSINWDDFPPAILGAAEIRRDDWGFFADLIYLSLDTQASTRRGPFTLDAEMAVQLTSATALGYYRVAEEGDAHLDLMAGGRLWVVDSALQIGVNALSRSFADDEQWVDPVVGVKGQYNFTDTVFARGWGMVGGFGVGSDIMWDVYGGLGYKFSEGFSTTIGWRQIGVDYANDGFVFDTKMSGPMIEGTFRF